MENPSGKPQKGGCGRTLFRLLLLAVVVAAVYSFAIKDKQNEGNPSEMTDPPRSGAASFDISGTNVGNVGVYLVYTGSPFRRAGDTVEYITLYDDSRGTIRGIAQNEFTGYAEYYVSDGSYEGGVRRVKLEDESMYDKNTRRLRVKATDHGYMYVSTSCGNTRTYTDELYVWDDPDDPYYQIYTDVIRPAAASCRRSSGWETAKALDNWLCGYMDPDESNRTVLDLACIAFSTGMGRCANYAAAYIVLLRESGIPAFYMNGTLRGYDHAWVIACLDGRWVFIDPTWDDTGSGSSFQYFGMARSDLPGKQYALGSLSEEFCSLLLNGEYERALSLR